MLLWQDTLCQVLHEWASLVFTGEHSVTFFPIYSQMAGFTLGLD